MKYIFLVNIEEILMPIPINVSCNQVFLINLPNTTFKISCLHLTLHSFLYKETQGWQFICLWNHSSKILSYGFDNDLIVFLEILFLNT